MTSPFLPASLSDRARLFTGLVPGAVACRQTAAHLWGLNALDCGATEEEWPVELLVPAPLEIPGCATHLDIPPESDVTQFRNVRLTTPERTALDCARWLARPDAVAVLDQFLRRGVDRDTLLRRAIGSAPLRRTLAMGDPGAASPRESWLRVTLVDGGLPRPRTQICVLLAPGRAVCLDLGWEEFKLAVEYDGRTHHSSSADRHRDETRRAELSRHGWRIIPVRRDLFPARTADLLKQIANALIECGWRPTPQQTTRILTKIRAARRRRR